MIAPLVAGLVLIGSSIVIAARNRHVKTPQRPIDRFLDSLKTGERPSDGQYQAALLSAIVTRRYTTARNITAHYGNEPVLATSLLDWALVHGRVDIVALLHQAFPELETSPAPTPNDTEYHPDLPPPASAEWGRLLAMLCTADPYYDAPNHIGAYQHHKRRVALFCDPVVLIGDLDLQTDVLTRDLHRLYGEHSDVLQYLRTEVELPDTSTSVVSRSGLLALLKCAGPRGALNWLSIPKERIQFPTTTSIFALCNGIF